MRVSEALLTQFRPSPTSEVSVQSLPDQWFSDAREAFGLDWWGEDGRPVKVTPVIAYTRAIPPLCVDLEWHALWHQCGSKTNNHIYMIAAAPNPDPTIKPMLDQVAHDFYDAEGGHFSREQLIVSLLIKYVEALGSIGLDCEASWRHLEEAVYPVDLTRSNLTRIFVNPPSISKLWRWGEIERVLSSNPAIILLTANSD